MQSKYVPPTLLGQSFNCPHCGAFSVMTWWDITGTVGSRFRKFDQRFTAAEGMCCTKPSLWEVFFDGENDENISGRLIYPQIVTAPEAHPDMPNEIRQDYEEARQICNASPRAAAALLRLCVQKICNTLLGKPGKIDDQIAELVVRGLPKRAQQALDSVRVIGNESVHPGTLDLNDTPELALALFRLVNLIVQDCITAPKEAEDIYGLLPEGKRQGIERRDAPKQPKG